MEIIKSKHDKRSYRIITLDNGLRAVLVHVPKETKPKDEVEEVINSLMSAVSASDKRPTKLNVEDKLSVIEKSPQKQHSKNSALIKSKKNQDPSNGGLASNVVLPRAAAKPSDDDEYTDIEESGDEEDDERMKTDESEDEKQDEDEISSTMALSIGVGSFLDPEEIPGLAHLAEHMVFMGSSKYPKENAFNEFVSKHGGYSNAATDDEQTTFILEIPNKYFHTALEMLAYFFIKPLMLQSSLDREIQAVDSEFVLKVPSDYVRLNLLLTSLAKPGHPMGNFGWGNLASLKTKPEKDGVDVYQHLHQFCWQYYVAQLMTLAIQSQDDLDTQEGIVRNIFSKIPSSSIPRPVFDSHGTPFDVETFAKLYHMKAVKQTHTLLLTWSLPPLQQHYKIRPLEIIAEALNYEGQGSLQAYFWEQAWAYVLWAGNDESGFQENTTHSIFEVGLHLSEVGLEHIHEIITMTLAYIKLLCTSDLHPVFREIQINNENKFVWQKEDHSTNFVELLGYNLMNYEPQYCIAGDWLLFEYDKNLITQCLEHLSSLSFNIIVQSSSFLEKNLPLREPYSQTPYNCQAIPQEWLDSWKVLDIANYPFLFLPPPNTFIPTEFSISPPDTPSAKSPVKILEDDFGSVWYKKDTKFLKPEAYIFYHLISPFSRKSSKNCYLINLLAEGMDQKFRLECYGAFQAGYFLSAHHKVESGMEIVLGGFNHKISNVLQAIVGKLKDLQLKPSVFNSLKLKLRRDFQNSLLLNGNLGRSLLNMVLDHDQWGVLEFLSHDPTEEELKNCVGEFLSSLRIQCLFQGNLTSGEVLEMHRMVMSELGCSPLPLDSVPPRRCWKVEPGEKILQVATFNQQDNNNLVILYCQLHCHSDSLRNNCLIDFLTEVMEEPLFDTLRTKEQLGYSVSCLTSCLHATLGFWVRIYSPSNKFSCKYLYERIKSFLTDYFAKLYKQPQKEFQEDVDNFIGKLRAEDIQLNDETGNNWYEILTGCKLFDRKESSIRLLKELMQEDFLEWLHSFVDSPATLSVQVVGNEDSEVTPFASMRPLEERLGNYELCTMHPPGAPSEFYVSDIGKFMDQMQLFHSELVY